MLAPRAHIDFETRHTVDLKDAGAEVVFEHPDTGVWGMAWVLGDDPSRVVWWTPNDPDPEPLLAHIRAGGMVVGHNVGFELYCWNTYVSERLRPGWPKLKIEQLDCTMARAMAVGMPGKLEQLCKALGVAEQKDEEGARLMKRMARPRSPKGVRPIVWWDVPERIARLGEYCIQDVRAEMACDAVLPPLTAPERRLWVHTLTVNDRGVRLDVPTIKAFARVIDIEVAQLDTETRRITNGAMDSGRQHLHFRKWLASRGMKVESVAKGEAANLEHMAVDRCDDVAFRLLEIRAQVNKASTAKLDAMTTGVCADGRSRGLLAYHGAATGRWAGRRWQPHNLPRLAPLGPKKEMLADARALIALAPDDAAPFMIGALYGSPMQAISKVLRALLIPAVGHVFVGADLSNIEGRVLAWLAGEQWKLDAFANYDRGEGPDLYKLAYARSFNKLPDDVTDDERQIGKVQELALGYQGGHGAFQTMGKNYGLTVLDEDVEPRPGSDWRTLTWKQTQEIKKGWRAAHPNVVGFWRDLEDAAIAAIDERTETQKVGRIHFRAARTLAGQGVLLCRLPSGRVLSYNSPRIVSVEVEHIVRDEHGNKVLGDDGKPLKIKQWRRQLRYEGLKMGHWTVIPTYGGSLAENVTQAVARDVLAAGLMRLEASGLPVVLHVHDEVLIEVREATDAIKSRVRACLTQAPVWAPDLPVACKVWSADRYLKD